MCGIAGILRLSDKASDKFVTKLSKKLLLNLRERGVHATGIALINTENQDVEILKRPVQSSFFVNFDSYKNLDFTNKNLVLLHCRQATFGNPQNNNNNHPFKSINSEATLVHNGTIKEWKAIEKLENIKREDSQVDSELILILYNKYKDIKKVLELVQDGGAFALYTKEQLYLYSSTRPLTIAYLPTYDCIVFASTTDILLKSLTFNKTMTYLNFFRTTKKLQIKAVKHKLKWRELITFDFKNNQMSKEELAFFGEAGTIKLHDSYFLDNEMGVKF